jgi:ABC-type transport system involved in cytochrome c biogenesis permease component
MSPLQFLRQSKHIARWVLVWFALSITAAVAAPVLNPQGLTLVCTAAGQTKLVGIGTVGNAADVGADVHQHLDCVLCLSLNAPPMPDMQWPLLATFAADKPVRVSDLHVPQLRALTLPARGPPATAGYVLSI